MKKLLLLLFSLLLSFNSYGESVYVKYRGTVSLDNFYCEKTRSSFVDRVCYQEQNNYVLVSLSGAYYQYCGVPYSTVNRWLNSTSKGSFYNSSIKGKFDCRYSSLSDDPFLEHGRGGVYLAAKGGERMKQGVRGMLGIEEPVVTEAKAKEAKDACKNGSGALWEIICND